ncbi:MAG TPA: response regulator transcription factor [Acidobacteriaceae bacterium]|nr:response regulator transcription factor [Acidobacteriaceae bacterium]
MNENDQMRPRIRIGLTEFEPLRVAGLREILMQRAEFEVAAVDIGTAFRQPGFDLILFLARRKAELCVLLGRLRMRHPDMKIIVMSADTDEESIMGGVMAGAKGWLEETATPNQILQAVDDVLNGSIWAPRRVLSKIVDRALGNAGGPLRAPQPRFTEREEEVLEQLVLARSNREIAQALSIQEQTVKSYVAKLMHKVGVGNRIALSMQAVEGDWKRNR